MYIRRPLLTALTTLTVLSALLLSQGTAIAATSFESAISAYKARNWQNALQYLRIAAAQDPKDANVHYYMANCLLYLNHADKALDEYRKAFFIDPNGPVAGYCEKAINSLASAKNTASSSTHSSSQQSAPLPTPPTELERQAQRLTDLGQDEQKRIEGKADQMRSALMKTAQQRANALKQDAANEAAIMSRARSTVSYTGPSPITGEPSILTHTVPSYTPEEIEKARHANDAEAKRILDEAAGHADSSAAFTREQGKVVADTANSLASQLKTKNLPGDAVLQSVGTNLFVRQYAPAKNTQKTPDGLSATPDKLKVLEGLHGKDGKLTVPQNKQNTGNSAQAGNLSITSQNGSPASRSSTTNVKGVVLPKDAGQGK